MNDDQRYELVCRFAEDLLDGMDWATMQTIVYEHLRDDYLRMTETELLGEIREFAPHLIEDSVDTAEE